MQTPLSNSNLRYIVFASKHGCEQRNLIVNNSPGTALFFSKKTLAINSFSSIKNVDDNLVIADKARVLATELGLMAGGQLYLQKALFEFRKLFPKGTLIDFSKWISKKRESSYDFRGYRDRISVRLKSILYEIKDIFHCMVGLDDRIFVEKNLIIEIPCSSAFIMSVVSGIILARMFRYKAANPDFMVYKNIIVLEDIQGTLRQDGYNPMLQEVSSYQRLMNESRYLNMVLVFNIQSVAKIPQIIREGASVVMSKRVNDLREVNVLRQMMNFSSEEQKVLMMHLNICDGVVTDKERGSIPTPVIVPEYSSKRITDDMIDQVQGPYIEPIINTIVREEPKTTSEKAKDKSQHSDPGFNGGVLGLSYHAYILLSDLQKFPFSFQDERRSRLEMNTDEISKSLDELVNKKLIEKYHQRINLGKGRGQFQLYTFTKKAINQIGKQVMIGKGGYIHAFWIYHCGKFYSLRGYHVKKEVFLPDGTSVDLVIEKKSQHKVVERIAVEIEMSNTDHILDNIRKCIKEKFNKIIITGYDSKLCKKVNKLILSDREAESWLQEKKLIVELLSTFLD